MAVGTVMTVDADGAGSIRPDSRGELVRFEAESGGGLHIGDRVSFLARITDRGIFADTVKRAHP